MRGIVIAFSLMVVAVAAKSLARQKRFDAWDGYYPSVGTGAYSSAGNGFAGAVAGGFGGWGGFGPIFNPYYTPYTSETYPRAPVLTYSPFPFVMPFPSIPWYKGPNVCVEKRMIDEPEAFKELMGDDEIEDGYRYQQEQTTCRGTDTSYVCSGRVMTNSGSKMFMTKYQCCHGFVRALNGQPGCIESVSKTPTSPKGGAPETTTALAGTPLTDKYRYDVSNKA